jgi:hypothetical protein
LQILYPALGGTGLRLRANLLINMHTTTPT